MSADLDSADLPDTPSQGAVTKAAVTRPPLTAAKRPATCFARHLQQAEQPPGNMWGCMSVIGLCPMPSASLSGVVGCMVASHANHCRPTDCSVRRVAIERRSVLLVGCCVCNLSENSIMSQRHNSESEESSSSSDYYWDGLPSPDVLRKYREPKWYMECGAQTESGGYTGPYRGLGIPHRGTAARGRAAMAARGIGDRARAGCVG